MQRMNFKTRNQLKRSVYVYIVLFFLVFLVVFLLLANLGRIVTYHNQQLAQSQESRTRAIFERRRSETESTSGNDASETGAILVFGKEEACEINLLGDDASCELLKNHLDMLKQPWKQVEATEESVSGLIIVADAQLDKQQLDWLMEQNAAGAHLLFVTMPPEKLLERKDVRALLGIGILGEKRIYPGARTSKEMMLGTILEYDGEDDTEDAMDIEAYDVELTQQVKVLAHVLTEDHLDQNVTDLSPLLWRHVPGEGKGYVYVCNGNFLSDETAYALLPTVLGDINGSYIYPIVNAYCLMIDGFPYADNEDRALWRRLYSRDGYGIQRELLQPEWERIENLYGAAMTCFSPAYSEIQTDANEEMRLYHTQFQQGNAELAIKRGDHCYLYGPDDPIDVVPMTAEFSFERDGRIQIPYQEGDWLALERNLFRTAGTVRGLGYIGLRIDVTALLEIQTGEGLPEFFEKTESLLGYHGVLYPWLERMTVQEAVERIDTYMRLSPSYVYHDHGITVQIDNFNGQAWFILKTHGKNPEIDNGSIQKIGENTYLVEIAAQTAEITWSGDGK